MNFRNILINSISAGVESFFNDVLEQYGDQSISRLEEMITLSQEYLQYIMDLLENIGARDEFNEDINTQEKIWLYAFGLAALFSGKWSEEDLPEEEMKEFAENWEEVKCFVDVFTEEMASGNKAEEFKMVNLTKECEEFYDSVAALENYGKSIFTFKKFKKMMIVCSKTLYFACAKAKYNIDLYYRDMMG